VARFDQRSQRVTTQYNADRITINAVGEQLARAGPVQMIVAVLLVIGMGVAAVQTYKGFEEGASRNAIRFWLDCEATQGAASCTRAFGPLQRTIDDCAAKPLLGREVCERLLQEERAARKG
jgi:hypothetical protein